MENPHPKRVKRNSDSSSASESDSEIVELSCNQRKAENGEPVCVMCGRFGAYICDLYEVDICSKECKEAHHSSKKKSHIQQSLMAKSGRVARIDKLRKLSSQQRPALPNETQCLMCSRFGVEKVLDAGHVCSIECKDIYMTPDRILQSPKLNLDPNLLLMSRERILDLRRKIDVTIVEGDTPPVILEFHQATINQTLANNMLACGFKSPTAVQSQVIPAVLDGSDVLVCSGTGTGKTAAYLIPIIHRIQFWVDKLSSGYVYGLILLPTREMAIQVEEIVKKLCRGIRNMKTGLVVGGLSSAQQTYRLDSSVQIIVATPGRLLEISPDLSQCFTVVLDECDVLLDHSFHEQIKSILRLLPSRHQTLMFSATISDEAKTFAKRLLYHPIVINVGKLSCPTEKVKQVVLWVENDRKKKKLLSILEDKRFNKSPVLVFVDSKLGAILLADFLLNKDILCGVIHADKTQQERNKIISELQSCRYSVLVSTGILGRGLDMPSVSTVIIFDLPPNMDQYIHQIGRALTKDKIGTAFVFVNNSNKSMFLQLYELSVSTMISLPLQLVNSSQLAYQKQAKSMSETREMARHK